jgi:hypothetical protein
MNRGGRASQVVDLVNFDVKGKGDVVPNEFKVRISEQVGNVVTRSGEEIIHAQHVVPLSNQSLAKM